MKEKKSFFQKLKSGFPDAYETDNNLPDTFAYDEHSAHDNWNTPETELDGELSIDMYQTDKDLVIEAMIAGVRPEDVQVSITRDIVTLSGKREANKSVTRDDYFYQELYWGTFSRSIMLPHEIDIEGAEAMEKHGMLIIKLPKIDKSRQNKLKVKSL